MHQLTTRLLQAAVAAAAAVVVAVVIVSGRNWLAVSTLSQSPQSGRPPGGQQRTCHVAADQVDWDVARLAPYAISGEPSSEAIDEPRRDDDRTYSMYWRVGYCGDADVTLIEPAPAGPAAPIEVNAGGMAQRDRPAGRQPTRLLERTTP